MGNVFGTQLFMCSGGIASLLYASTHGVKEDRKVFKHIEDALKEYKGQSLGIDASILLNHIVKSKRLAKSYVEDDFRPALKELEKRLRVLLAAQIIPMLVFDGLNQGTPT